MKKKIIFINGQKKQVLETDTPWESQYTFWFNGTKYHLSKAYLEQKEQIPCFVYVQNDGNALFPILNSTAPLAGNHLSPPRIMEILHPALPTFVQNLRNYFHIRQKTLQNILAFSRNTKEFPAIEETPRRSIDKYLNTSFAKGKITISFLKVLEKILIKGSFEAILWKVQEWILENLSNFTSPECLNAGLNISLMPEKFWNTCRFTGQTVIGMSDQPTDSLPLEDIINHDLFPKTEENLTAKDLPLVLKMKFFYQGQKPPSPDEPISFLTAAELELGMLARTYEIRELTSAFEIIETTTL